MRQLQYVMQVLPGKRLPDEDFGLQPGAWQLLKRWYWMWWARPSCTTIPTESRIPWGGEGKIVKIDSEEVVVPEAI